MRERAFALLTLPAPRFSRNGIVTVGKAWIRANHTSSAIGLLADLQDIVSFLLYDLQQHIEQVYCCD